MPSRFPNGGLNDRHAVMNRSSASIYLRVVEHAEGAWRRGPPQRSGLSSEKAIAAALRGLSVRELPFAAHHVVPPATQRMVARSRRADVSPWGVGFGAKVKIAVSRAAQRSLQAAPVGCEVAKASAYQSEDVLYAHAEAACLAVEASSAPLCGPHGPPRALPGRLKFCARAVPRYAARFLAEGMDKPGHAGLALVEAAQEVDAEAPPQECGLLATARERESGLARVAGVARVGSRIPPKGLPELLASAAGFLRKACRRRHICERGRGENAMTWRCPWHFCSALVRTLVWAGRTKEADEELRRLEKDRHSFGLTSRSAGASECAHLPRFFRFRTVDFENASYCLIP
mmetsp:Transcript_16573/g.58053  ORF Transcript_16573/g.58053 Transcript_16573/m.58053 type:complete len:345 (+) Transcript_16573:781-1815(+)